MSAFANVISLFDGTTTYPLSFPDPSVQAPPEVRGSWVDIGNGVDPIKAHVFITSVQYANLPANFKSGQTSLKLVMSGQTRTRADPTTTIYNTLTFAQFYLLKASVFRQGTNAADGTPCPLYECLLTSDAQSWNSRAAGGSSGGGRAYNLLSTDRTKFIGGAVSSSSPKTWTTMLGNFASDLGITITVTSGTPAADPFNFIVQGPAVSGLRRLLLPFGLQLQVNPFGASQTYKIVEIDYTQTDETAQLTALAATSLFEGGNAITPPQTQIPAALLVAFPKYPVPTPAAATNDLTPYTYNSQSSPVTGGSGETWVTFAGDRWDVSSPTYTQNLATIAAERATRFYKRALVGHSVFVFMGGYDFVPGNNIRRVRLSMDEGPQGGWFTTVWTHGLLESPREDWQSNFDHMQPPYFPEHCSPVVGIACSPRDDGTTDFLGVPGSSGGGVFPVQVTKDGGSNGTQSTQASWTYTVKDVTGTTTLGTTVALGRPRPNGEINFQAANSYGIAFYKADGTTLDLWDAGETPTTGC